jgi:hypothetical protein
MLTNEEKKHILKEHLRIVEHISDKDYQRRIWINGEGPECDDLDETCCHFFDDGESIMENYRDFSITDDQYAILKEFGNRFYNFTRHNGWPPEFINTDEWTEITHMAKDVLRAFDYKN